MDSSQYWKDESYKRQQILNLKDAGRILVPYSHSKQRRFISVDIPEVLHLCNLVEGILLHGIKIKEFQGIVPLWGLLERLEVLQPPCVALRNTVGATSCAGNLRTPLAKGRGWIRQSLNSQNLDESLQFMISQPQWLSKFYYPDAILLSRDDSTALVAVVRSFKALSFAIPVDDANLNETPLHLVKQLTVPAPAAVPTAPSTQAQQTSGGGGGGFDSFLRSFEQGFDHFVSKVDSLLDTLQAPDSNVNVTPVVTATQQLLQPAIQEVRSLSLLFLDDSTPAAPAAGSATAVPSFFNRSSLQALITSEYRCAHALLEPRLGTPNMALKLINVISNHASTPGLFRQQAPVMLIDELIRLIETEKGPQHLLPSSSINTENSIAVCCHVLITWLNQLPEPLLGYDHYEAYLATVSLIEELPGERLQCLSVLISDIPWMNRPLVCKLFQLFGKCLEEKSNNGLNSIALALLFGPCLLRPLPVSSTSSTAPQQQQQQQQQQQSLTEGELLAISAVSSPVIELLINHSEVILKPLKEEQELLSLQLTNKANKVRAWQMALATPLTLDGNNNSEELNGVIRRLYTGLTAVEAMLLSAAPSSSSSDSMAAILTSERWKTCAMLSSNKHNQTVIAGELEEEAGGLLALQSLSNFLNNSSSASNSDKARVAAAFASSPRRRFISLPLASLQVTIAVGEALGLLSSTAYATRTIDNLAPLQVLAKGPAWNGLFKDVNQSQQVMFDIGLMAMDMTWKEVLEADNGSGEEMAAQALFKTRSLLWEIISQRPSSASIAWEQWLKLQSSEQDRIAHRRRLQQQQQKQQRLPVAGKVQLPKPVPLSTASSQHDQGIYMTAPPSAAPPAVIKIVDDDEDGLDDEDDGEPGFEHDDTLIQPAALVKTREVEAETKGEEFKENEKERGNRWDGHRIVIGGNKLQPAVLQAAQAAPSSSTNTAVATATLSTSSATAAAMKAASIIAEDDGSNDIHNAAMAAAAMQAELAVIIPKNNHTSIHGGSKLLTSKMILALETALPQPQQCYDWRLLYRTSVHGSSLSTLLRKAAGHAVTLLVIQDSNGAVFGALLTEQLRQAERDKYYGNGTIGVWSFYDPTTKQSDRLKYYSWSYKNSYFLLSSSDSLAVGGGGHFALYLDSDLNRGSSGPCATYNSPCLASKEEFACLNCELFALQTPHRV